MLTGLSPERRTLACSPGFQEAVANVTEPMPDVPRRELPQAPGPRPGLLSAQQRGLRSPSAQAPIPATSQSRPAPSCARKEACRGRRRGGGGRKHVPRV